MAVTKMKTRRLGSSDLEITPIGLGAWAMGGGGWDYGWGHQNDLESIAAMHRAIELGINWIDTAAVYGLGRSEEVVARALRELPQASRPFVFTKCGLVWDDRGNISHCLKSASVRNELEHSLRRLKVETIDLYQIHWPSFPPAAPAPDIERAWEVLASAREAGKIRFIGVSNFTVEHLERVQTIAPVTSLQPPYSMLARGIEADILPYCEKQNIGVIVYSPMQSGLLSGAMTRGRVESFPDDDWRKTKNPEFQEPRLTRNLELVERLRAIGAPHRLSPGVVAVSWTLNHPAVTAAIVGARRPSQVDGFIRSAEFRLGEDELAQIEEALAAE